MKTLKEIEEKIKENLREEAGAWGTREHTHAREARANIREDAEKYQGWLVGLGIAKGILLVGNSPKERKDYIIIARGMNRHFEPTPYEQGIKEALEWVLGD